MEHQIGPPRVEFLVIVLGVRLQFVCTVCPDLVVIAFLRTKESWIPFDIDNSGLIKK